jgi:hypothetical protein
MSKAMNKLKNLFWRVFRNGISIPDIGNEVRL